MLSRSFDSAGVRIRYLEAGRGDAVVLMHGFASHAQQQWVDTGVFDQLAQRHRVIAIDGRGHGLSDKPHDPALYGPQAAQDFTRLLDHLGLDRAHAIGHSLGAILNGYLLTRAPMRFKSCVLVGAPPRFRWTADDHRQLQTEAAELLQGSRRSQILRLWSRDRPLPDEEEIRRRSARALAGQDHRALAASRLGGAMALITADQVRAITVPTLAIAGTADPYLAEFQALQALNPAIALVTIPQATHASTPAHPLTVQAIVRFLVRHGD